MRFRVLLLAFILVVGSFVLPHAVHAGVPFFGPVIPDAQNRCAGSFGLLITVINNLISLLITLTIIFVAPLMIAYAGFLYVVNPVNPNGRGEANKILQHVVVGTILAFASYLIVAALMAVLYNPTAVGSTWADLVGSRGALPCIPLASSLNQAEGAGNVGVTSVGSNGGQFLSLPVRGDCTPSSIAAAAAKSPQYPLSTAQAQTLSCLATPESGCNLNAGGATTPGGSASYALGVFQIVPGWSDDCHSLNIPVCAQAAGVAGPLRCSSAFSCVNKVCTVVNQQLWNACQRAGTNFDCNVAAASCLVKGNRSMSDWAADPRAATQRNCIATYNK